MNREIIFRGKRKLNGEWVYGSLVKVTPEASDDWDLIVLTTRGAEQDEWETVRAITKTIGQYIGTKDKNGIEIFEDDIVAIEAGTITNRPEQIGIIKYTHVRSSFVIEIPEKFGSTYRDITRCVPTTFEDGLNGYNVDRTSEIDYVLEVIGNIHENPELLGTSTAYSSDKISTSDSLYRVE